MPAIRKEAVTEFLDALEDYSRMLSRAFVHLDQILGAGLRG